MKGYKIADLTAKEIESLQAMEKEFFNKFHEEIILVAWKKAE